ncbi:alpha/beta fold hydrolase [Gudongella sp. DL1XJH-153]|uniref:alpha/beta fold hydrolase n=1 Tax=Gudongella sp. DL1XJH-153 TaxID=3409804 RepID=UPI003BB4D55D
MNMSIIFIILLIAATAALLTSIILSVSLLIKKRKEKAIAKTISRLKGSGVVLFGLMVIMVGISLFSQFTSKTPPILNEQGDVLEGSIAELTKIELNERKEWISIRGENKQNPVLLFLAGGPGGTQMAAVRHDLAELEKHFVVVNWDQPGSGKSYYAAAKNSLDVQDYIDDGLALTEYLCERFKQEKIYVAGESWGSALGVFLASETPDRYHAVIGTGQMVDFLKTELLDYDKAMEIANEKKDFDKIKKLTENGKPPYYGSDVTWNSAEYLNYLSAEMSNNPEIQNNGYNTFRDIFSPEYGIIDKVNYFRGILMTFNHVYPQLYDIDLRIDYNKLEVPIYFFLGRHDINAPLSLVEDYVNILDAPHKEIVWFENSGHNPWINESDRFVEELLIVKDRDN